MRARRLPLLAAALLAACASEPPRTSAAFPSASWPAAALSDAPYLLAPGDKVDVVVHTAPELSRELVVAPDGRVRMPLASPVMAMALTPDELADILRAELASELIDPDLDVIVTGFASQKIFIGGEVRTPGLFDLPGEINPLQAIVMAGGLTRGPSRAKCSSSDACPAAMSAPRASTSKPASPIPSPSAGCRCAGLM